MTEFSISAHARGKLPLLEAMEAKQAMQGGTMMEGPKPKAPPRSREWRPEGSSGKRNAIGIAAKLKIAQALDGIVEQVGEGVCRYKPGHSDKIVAESMPFECSEHNVFYVRFELYGRLEKSAKPKKEGSKVKNDTALKSRVSALEKKIWAIEDKMARLIKLAGADPDKF